MIPLRSIFLLTPLREGRLIVGEIVDRPEHLFLLTPLREGRPVTSRLHGTFRTISTHAPAGGATPPAPNLFRRFSISTHAPAGGATQARTDTVSRGKIFLLTPLREGRPEAVNGFRLDEGFLLTPLREGRRSSFSQQEQSFFISTHAPAGGATRSGRFLLHRCNISTHAPAGGATQLCALYGKEAFNFYSRPCGRGDVHVNNWREDNSISTHAPAGGATK